MWICVVYSQSKQRQLATHECVRWEWLTFFCFDFHFNLALCVSACVCCGICFYFDLLFLRVWCYLCLELKLRNVGWLENLKLFWFLGRALWWRAREREHEKHIERMSCLFVFCIGIVFVTVLKKSAIFCYILLVVGCVRSSVESQLNQLYAAYFSDYYFIIFQTVKLSTTQHWKKKKIK